MPLTIRNSLMLLLLAIPPQQGENVTDLRGIWQAQVNANVNLETSGVIVEPADGRIPYRPEALIKRQQNFKKRATADPQAKCFQPGVPRATYGPTPFQIFQTTDRVVIVYQEVHAYRIISMEGRPHPDGISFYMGDSRGHWEGKTLVVDVKNFMEDTWLDMVGNYHSDALHVIERYTRTGPTTMTR